ncbi:MAG: hypothetical protein KatS3mg108_0420 [Isosphaeraceae bacterium]|jgi:hypothetical protein|nr:MAG: hypothetical protein KatS3mg108_0420 [Isosphaeraceae bacterium]
MTFRQTLRIAPILIMIFCASNARAQLVAGGGQGVGWSWPRYREYRDFAGQSYADIGPTGRRGYYVALGLPGFDDWGTGPSMAYSPIFNAPAPLPRPALPPATRAPRGFLRRWFEP